MEDDSSTGQPTVPRRPRDVSNRNNETSMRPARSRALDRDVLAKNRNGVRNFSTGPALAPGVVSEAQSHVALPQESDVQDQRMQREALAKNRAQHRPACAPSLADGDGFQENVLSKNRSQSAAFVAQVMANTGAFAVNDYGQIIRCTRGVLSTKTDLAIVEKVKENVLEKQGTLSQTSSSSDDSDIDNDDTSEEEPWFRKEKVRIFGGFLFLLLLIGIGIAAVIPFMSKESSPASPLSSNDKSTETPQQASGFQKTNSITVSVLIQLDDRPSETSFILSCDDNRTDIHSRPYTDKDSNHLVLATHNISLSNVEGNDPLNCVFTLTDSGDNGVQNGWFELFVGDDITKNNNILLVNKTKAAFTNKEEVAFEIHRFQYSGITPSPTLSPQVLYQPKRHGATVPITLTLQLDEYPEHTGWSLVCDEDGTIANITPRAYYGQNSALITETYNVVKDSTCTFTIIDTSGDGMTNALISGQDMNGFYAIFQGTGSFSNPESLLALETNFNGYSEVVKFQVQSPLREQDYGDRIAVLVNVKTDDFPQETSWTLDCNNVLYGVPPFVYGGSRKEDTLGHKIYVEEGNDCLFTMRDLAGDGFGMLTTDIFGNEGLFLSGQYAIFVLNEVEEEHDELLFLDNTFVTDAKNVTLKIEKSIKPDNRDIPISIVVKTDDYPKDIGWTLQCNGIYYAYSMIGDYGEEDDNEIHVTTVLVQNQSSCEFILTDALGDGICCENGVGYYGIYLGQEEEDRSLLASGGHFTAFQEIADFVVEA